MPLKGLLLLGVQGCGKSLTAKAIATSWKLPLVRLDMGRIYSGLIGSSEENLRIGDSRGREPRAGGAVDRRGREGAGGGRRLE